jgi:hypothetical protein
MNGNGENCMIVNLIFCMFHQKLSGGSNGRRDGWDV